MGKRKPTIGDRLRAARVERGWSQSDLARAAGCSVSRVSQIERGLVQYGAGALHRMAQALGVSVDELRGNT